MGRIALIVGCGLIGSATARILAGDGVFDSIIVADKNGGRARTLAKTLGDRAKAANVDITSQSGLESALSEVSVFLNTTGPFDRRVADAIETSIRLGVPYADVNDEVEVLREVFANEHLDSLARERGVTVVPGLGVSPGQTNIIAGYLSSQMDQVEEFRFLLVNDIRYRSEAVWRHRFRLFGGQAALYDDGAWIQVPGMSEFEDVEFPDPWRTIRCYTVGLEPITLPESFKDVKHVSMKREFLHPLTGEMMRDFIRYGLTSEDRLEIGGGVTPAELSASLLSNPVTDHLFEFDSLPPELPRQVRAKGIKDGRPVELILTYSYPSNMIQDATASCLAAGARSLVSGQVPEPGILAPERLDPAPFLNDMRSGGVVFTLDEKYDVGRR